jgi:hypothetical protein
MESNLEALRLHLERLLDVARPDDYLCLTRTIAAVKQAEVLRANRQALDSAAWRRITGTLSACGHSSSHADRFDPGREPT